MDNSVPPRPSPVAERCSTYFVMCNARCYNRSVLPNGARRRRVRIIMSGKSQCQIGKACYVDFQALGRISPRGTTRTRLDCDTGTIRRLALDPVVRIGSGGRGNDHGTFEIVYPLAAGEWRGPVFAGLQILTSVPQNPKSRFV